MKNIILVAIVIVSLISCQKEFKVNNKNYKPKLVLNNLFQQNSPFEIRVSNSVNVYDSILPGYIETATVKLYVNDMYTETLSSGGVGYYYAQTIPSPGNTYKITVSNDGYDPIEATNTLPKAVKIIDWFYVDSTSVDNNGDYFGDLSFTLEDPAEENSYLISLEAYNDQKQEYEFLASFSSEDQSLNQNLARRLENGEYLFTDNLFNGKQKAILLRVPSNPPASSYLLKLYSLSKDAYFYSYTKPQNAGQPNTTPIYTNVKNGLGIFAGRSLNVDTIK